MVSRKIFQSCTFLTYTSLYKIITISLKTIGWRQLVLYNLGLYISRALQYRKDSLTKVM